MVWQMQLAKDVIDVGLSTNNLEPMLRFWQHDVGLRFDHVLPVRRCVPNEALRSHREPWRCHSRNP
jgi:hypothetical protein